MGTLKVGYYKGKYVFDEHGVDKSIYYSEGIPMIRGTCEGCENYEKIYNKEDLNKEMLDKYLEVYPKIVRFTTSHVSCSACLYDKDGNFLLEVPIWDLPKHLPNVPQLDLADVFFGEEESKEYWKQVERFRKTGEDITLERFRKVWHEHEFVMAHGSCFSGNVSYHGHCKLCNVEMDMCGSVDKDGNGEVVITTREGDFKRKKSIKDGVIN